MKKLFFLALMAFLWLPATTWAENEVGDEGHDDEVDNDSGETITSTTISLTYKITKAATGTTEGEAGEVELESVYFAENNTIGALSIPHIIHNFVIEDGAASVYYYTVTGIGNHAFNCGTGSSNTNADKATLNGTLTSVTIPYTVTSIGQYAFNTSKLQSVTIIDTDETPSQLETIGMQAFYANHYLTSITLPSSVTDIQTWAFYSCNGLTSIVIPDGVTTIKANSFGSCTALETVTMNGSATLAGDAFANCTSLKSIILTGSEPSENGGSEPSSGDMPFKNDEGEAITLYVPTGSAANYLKTQWANDVANEEDVNLSWNFNSISILDDSNDEEGVYYATYYTDAMGEFGEDITPNIVIEVEESGEIDYNAVSGVIPANTGLLLTTNDYDALNSGDTYYYHPYGVDENTETASVSGNMLLGTNVEGGITTVGPNGETSGYYFYKLALDAEETAGTIGFYWGADEGGAFTSGAGKAYLAVSSSDGDVVPTHYSFKKNDEGDTTGISAVESASEKTVSGIYTIQGVRVNNMNQPGLYIVDGKKVLVK